MTVLLLVFLSSLGGQTKIDNGFDAWFKQFREAVVRKDAPAVSKGAHFPLQWENGPTRDIQAAADLTARFDFYFTAEIKEMFAKRVPSSEGTEVRTITWKARNNEYTLYFKREQGVWAFDGLSEGPP